MGNQTQPSDFGPYQVLPPPPLHEAGRGTKWFYHGECLAILDVSGVMGCTYLHAPASTYKDGDRRMAIITRVSSSSSHEYPVGCRLEKQWLIGFVTRQRPMLTHSFGNYERRLATL